MSTKQYTHRLNITYQSKDKVLKKQIKTIFQYLENNTATNTMVSHNTGVSQKNICRFKRDLEKQGLLIEVEKKLCKITGFSAWYLSTNKDIINKLKPIKK
jgi:hypothetical protein